MGYFSNGTEGEQYMQDYCDRCVHNRYEETGEVCPVWGAHLDFSYQLCNEKGDPGKSILDALIPPSKDGLYNAQCTMFHAKAAVGDLFKAA